MASAAAGFVAGGLIFRWSMFWDWITSADWTSLPAVIVGTTIPAVAGVAFAQVLTKRAATALRETELDVAERRETERAQRAAHERQARRAAWETLFDEIVARVPEHVKGPVADAVAKRARGEWEAAGRVKGENREAMLGDLAATAEWGVGLRASMRPISDSIRRLIEDHGLEALTVVLTAIDALARWSETPELWPPLDYDDLVQTRRDVGEEPRTSEVRHAVYKSSEALRHLRRVAQDHRAQPHDADDASLWLVIGSLGSGQQPVDVSKEFADLSDLVEALLADVAPGAEYWH